MNPVPSQSTTPPPWFPMLPPDPPRSRAFWDTTNTRNQLVQLQDTLSLAKAM